MQSSRPTYDSGGKVQRKPRIQPKAAVISSKSMGHACAEQTVGAYTLRITEAVVTVVHLGFSCGQNAIPGSDKSRHRMGIDGQSQTPVVWVKRNLAVQLSGIRIGLSCSGQRSSPLVHVPHNLEVCEILVLTTRSAPFLWMWASTRAFRLIPEEGVSWPQLRSSR